MATVAEAGAGAVTVDHAIAFLNRMHLFVQRRSDVRFPHPCAEGALNAFVILNNASELGTAAFLDAGVYIGSIICDAPFVFTRSCAELGEFPGTLLT